MLPIKNQVPRKSTSAGRDDGTKDLVPWQSTASSTTKHLSGLFRFER